MRGNILREQYDDLKRRIDALDVEPRSVCFSYIKSTYGPVNEGYELASSADRERILNELRDVSRRLWSAVSSAGTRRPHAEHRKSAHAG